MKSLDYEKTLEKIRKSILLLKGYTSNEYVDKIINACRLKPYSLFNGTFKDETKLEEHWVDEYGNSLKIENKKLVVYLNNPELLNTTSISTDLFYGKDIKYFISNAEAIIILYFKNNYIFFIKCFDQYLRAFAYSDGMHQISPILFGIEFLEEIFKNIERGGMHELDVKRLQSAFDIERGVVLSLPSRVKPGCMFEHEKFINDLLESRIV